ncbi:MULTISPECIES: type II secretion system F family protein [Pseudomonas]|uniref:Putative type II secretion system protein putative membrane protein n=1 Tax=Pseudomonas brassicacearum (strain NFM421) TaxID=994484 RepID=F2KKB3_PSEBN|nr:MULTISPECIES: type II secretion system F family protein [Pseudomonas]EIK66191.1 Flp pilus assembly protein, TadC family [Pseudomonas fluorescens Q8r1-96]AEA70489.1 putative type II secretion system protein; putative membrane protein [Pseudomonas brassicacearum subsp. brassicacearum NFM421]KAB0524158.1 type II secretion system F family protein [Pseudomonas brassicacearum subsp. brassicacearum]NJP61039.1 type II secretion system F family protein [Pseudomonas brassicacearum]PJH88631.1 type II 
MDFLLGLLSRFTGNEELARLLFVTVVGVSTVLAVVALMLLMLGLQDPVQRRLALIKRGYAGNTVGQEAPSNLQLLLERVGQRFASTDQAHTSATQTLLTHAGYRSASAVQMYWAVRLMLPLLMVGVALLLLPMVKVSVAIGLLAVTLVAGIGWLLPAIYVGKRKQARQGRLRAAFPDALDLMVVCVESGLALPTTIERVAEEMSVSQVELAEELALVNAQIRAGITSTEALKQLAVRTGLEDIQGLVSLLAQSIRFGTSVADTLRIYADEFRDRRTQAAEEMGAKIGTKLIFPLIFCLWPSFFLVAIGPAMIGVFRAFGNM